MAQAALFRNVYEKDHLHLFDTDDGSVAVKKVVDFLKLSNHDVAKIAGVKPASVRYDDRIPTEIRERISEIANICNIVAAFFAQEPHKVALWFAAQNPQLGGISPRDMIRLGRYRRLLKFVTEAREQQLGTSP